MAVSPTDSGGGDPALQALRDAVRLSPENQPLRIHYAITLLGRAFFDQAEREYRACLALWPDHEEIKLGLATAFYHQGKASHALLLAEELAERSAKPARALVLLARIQFRSGEVPSAVEAYKRALAADPAVADAELSARLGVRLPAKAPESRPTDKEDDPFEDLDDPATDELFEGRVRTATETPAERGPERSLEKPKINFQDVGGMDALKDEIRIKIIHPLTHADLYRSYGKAVGGGILLYGPPGCGKTHLARATAGEIRANFIAVGINDVLDMWIGQSERNLHDIFENARAHTPCVVFFDEVDALGASRADMRSSSGRHLINQFLSELDGVKASNDGLLILAATNAPWHLDSAFRRPGRFDRLLFVPPPDADARAAILRVMARGKPIGDLDFEQVAKKTENFSGADLKGVFDLAIEHKLREAMRDGVPRPLITKDLLSAAGNVKPSTREWFSTARNHALYANQGGLYDDVVKYLKL